ncbi:glycosyltransferase family protein [Candidatus Venteria ishoeyi]|uniref:Mannosylfructose-phosphate synthase n=1 Tax=Candidatus Venteria ishoeyi TaxID=1899563 RepID=A0A1H6F657_9GAMM|nr:glycosyltransferase [Candidatus Venteria ishoeyi]SEH05612.1 Mannosylfructose-phosphate synthase [Candidatus Venteria ishoeyi]
MEALIQRLKNPKVSRNDALRYRLPERLAYIVNHSYPYSNNGYAVRTHGIASALVQQGCSVIVINSPGNPWDLDDFDEKTPLTHQKIDGVRYLYLRKPSKKEHASNYFTAAIEALKDVLRLFKPTAVMAASNWANAFPAGIAAKELGLPFFYEVRGFWELSHCAREPAFEHSQDFRFQVQMETLITQSADQVFTLNRFMKEELIRRGVKAEKIELVPNGYSGELPDLDRSSKLSRADIGCKTQYVVGYVGSFSLYEGLDELLKACAQVRQQGIDVSLLLVGSSNSQGLLGVKEPCFITEELKKLAKSLDFEDYLHLPGRIPQDELGDYYALIDLVVIPRKSLPVCELVSPIKPLEVAAYGRALLVSDVKPLKEISIEAGVSQYFRADDAKSLVEKITEIITEQETIKKIERGYLSWVSQKRIWSKTIITLISKLDSLKITKKIATSKESAKDTHHIECLPFENLLPKVKPKLKIASILDTFSHACFAPTCELISITPKQWEQQLAEQKIDMLLVESAWHGNNDTWLNRVAKYNAPPDNQLSELIQWAKKSDIPTVFWNKEDPSNFERFIETAIKFDYIFTTDENCIEQYRKHTSAEKYIAALPFAAEPSIHNSHLKSPRLPITSFAGTYYTDDFGTRRQAMDMLLRTASNYGLDIFDRMFNLTGKDKQRYKYPDDLQPYIRGSLNYEEMLEAYRRYRVALNVNSVSGSPTMFSRRVFELLACGTPVVSTPSIGIDRIFGGLITTIKTEQEASEALHNLMNNPLHWLKTSVQGVRTVFQSHTYTHRLNQIAQSIGLGAHLSPLRDMVVILHPDGNPHSFTTMLRNQTISPFEVVVVGLKYKDDNVKFHLEKIMATNIKATALPKENIASYLKIRHPDAGIAICNSKHYYGANYLLDACISLSSSSDIQASTMQPTKNAEHYLKNLTFKDIENLGMDTKLAYSGSIAVITNSELLEPVLFIEKDGDFSVPFPIENRSWLEFVPATDKSIQHHILNI